MPKYRVNFISKNLRKPEKMNRECKTEQAGFIPLKERIDAMKHAGQTLHDYRAGRYGTDFVKPGEDPIFDPTQVPGFDLADVSAITRQLFEKASQKATEATQAPTETKKEETGHAEPEKASQSPQTVSGTPSE